MWKDWDRCDAQRHEYLRHCWHGDAPLFHCQELASAGHDVLVLSATKERLLRWLWVDLTSRLDARSIPVMLGLTEIIIVVILLLIIFGPMILRARKGK